MASLQGTSNLSKQPMLGDMADAKLAQMLQLYKPVATIRDMKQVFMYTCINAGISDIHPLRYINPSMYGKTTGATINNNFPIPTPVAGFPWTWNENTVPPPGNVQVPYFSGNQWFTPIGTERKMDITNLINDLCDIRVPRDKLVIEITLAECQIEADSTNWTRIPDYVFFIKAIGDSANNVPLNSLSTQPTFRRSIDYIGLTDNDPANKNAIQQFIPATQQATKLSQPETLFVRIKELANGEPYNWSVTNSGTYTVDKNQPVVMKFGDMPCANLTVEFGHLVFPNRDLTQERIVSDGVAKNNFIDMNDPSTVSPNYVTKRGESSRISEYKYLDYNWEHFNTIVTDPAQAQIAPQSRHLPRVRFSSDFYIDQYINSVDTSRIPFNYPINRPPFFVSPSISNGGVQPDNPPFDLNNPPVQDPNKGSIFSDYIGQGLPLKYNQQIRAIVMRWSIKVVSLF